MEREARHGTVDGDATVPLRMRCGSVGGATPLHQRGVTAASPPRGRDVTTASPRRRIVVNDAWPWRHDPEETCGQHPADTRISAPRWALLHDVSDRVHHHTPRAAAQRVVLAGGHRLDELANHET